MIFELMSTCLEKNASDLHFKVGYKPILRVDGSMRPLNDKPVITESDYANMLESILDDVQLVSFQRNLKLDVGYSFQNARFRVNFFKDYKGGNAVFRLIPFTNLSFDDIELPDSARSLISKESGIVLVTGATGAGKSTTLSAYISHINRNFNKTIITIEDPIEYIFEDENSLISQRQVGVDCLSFEDGIKGALQTDCDIMMVGELRNPEAVEMTLTAAESGKLVFATLHSNTAIQALDRFVNLFPVGLHSQIFGRLANNLNGVVTQSLLPSIKGKGRIAAFEILLNSQSVKGCIYENRLHLISSTVSLEESLINLVIDNKVDMTEALLKTNNPDFVKRKVTELRRTGGIL